MCISQLDVVCSTTCLLSSILNLLKMTQYLLYMRKYTLDMILIFLLMQEFYADFVAVDPYHFTLNMASNHMYMLPAVVDPSGLQHFCDRVVDGLAAIFLALKRRPVIRYSHTSDIAKRIAQEAMVSMQMFHQYYLHIIITRTCGTLNACAILQYYSW